MFVGMCNSADTVTQRGRRGSGLCQEDLVAGSELMRVTSHGIYETLEAVWVQKLMLNQVTRDCLSH